MKKMPCLLILVLMHFASFAQKSNWTENDRKYLLDNLIRSRDELVKETEKLSEKQWSFHESSDRWSISEVVEHLAIYELIFDREISLALKSIS